MKIEKTELFTYLFLVLGIILLIFTFFMAYVLLIAKLDLSTGLNLSEALGEILGPIAESLIKVLYLGVMGWVGSILTIRGIQLLRESKQTPKPKEEPVKESKSKKQEEKLED
jgi:hypothetical protein